MTALQMTRPWEAPPTGHTVAFADRMAAVVPVITTDRFRLRAPRIGDFPVYARFLTDDAPLDTVAEDVREEAWLDFCQIVASWPLRGYGSWTVEGRDSGAALGAIILNHEFGDPEVELGWTVALGHEGQGIATEAAKAVRDHAFGALGMGRLVSYIDPENAASIRVAERLGARRAADHEGCQVWVHHPVARNTVSTRVETQGRRQEDAKTTVEKGL
jgi:RimJ/RimL family protein N-acetyltransferase